MGKVYRVEDKKIKAEIALKLIKPEISPIKKHRAVQQRIENNPDDLPQERLPHV